MAFQSRNEEFDLTILFSKGDAHAFERIYRATHEQVFRYALYLTKSRDTAEEILQEVYVRAWEKRERFSSGGDLLPYLSRMVQNLVFDLFRKAGRDRILLEKIFQGMTSMASQEHDPLLLKDLQAGYAAAISKLPPRQRVIFGLRREEELSYQEIASRLNISVNTVRNHLAEAVGTVRSQMKNFVELPVLLLLGLTKIFFL